MKRQIIISVCAAIFCLTTKAQSLSKNPAREINRTNVWHFGSESISFANDAPSLHFDNGSPVVQNVGKPAGFATMCDTNGNLQLYGGGFALFNKVHAVFENGTGVIGYNSNTIQHSLAIPKPGNPDLIYYFTVPVRFYYNLIDMREDGGNGDIIEKNVEILSDPPGVGAKIAAVHHCNGHDIWVMVHELYKDKFRAYLVTDSGISATPVITQIGPMDDSPGGSEQGGFMKFSPNGKRLGIVFLSYDPDSLAPMVFDFDNSTGILSNPITLQFNQSTKGISFSPDNSKLYIGTSYVGELYQYNLEAGSPEDIALSRIKIFENPIVAFTSSMQIGRDGKIYVTQLSPPSNAYLGVINNPNALDTLCNYDWHGVHLNGSFGSRGLTNTAESYFYTGSSAYPCYGEPISGISQSAAIADAKVYPNPFSEHAIIEIYGNLLADQSPAYWFFDATGRECKVKFNWTRSGATMQQAVFNKGNLQSGLYFLIIKTPVQNWALKLSIL